MRFSRTSVYALVAVLVVGGLGAGLATGASKRSVKTKVTMKFQDSDYSDAFTGKVRAKAKRALKRKCTKKRTVIVRQVGGGSVGSDSTDKRGRWAVAVGGAAEPGQYFAKAKRKTVKKGGKKVVCKKGKSKTITVS